MSDFSVPIVRILDVYDHPNADRLSINKVLGFEAITNKREDGSHRFKPGDLVAYIPEDAIVPEYLLKREGFWNDEENKGFLAGTRGDRVKCKMLRGIPSQGILIPTKPCHSFLDGWMAALAPEDKSMFKVVVEHEDVASFLGVTKRVIVIPASMAGEVYACPHTVKYDFNSIQKEPDLFQDGDIVEVSEKLHGTFCNIGIVQTDTWDDAFGSAKNVYISSKGLGADGKAFKNNEKNIGKNLYVRTLLALNVPEKLIGLGEGGPGHRVTLRLFGEVYGAGVQDLAYGASTPTFRIFDIKHNDAFLPPDSVRFMAMCLGLETVPILYRGPYSLEKMVELRDGMDTISGTQLREGIVIRAVNGHRRIAKYVSPHYLTRKGSQTEYQ